MLQFRLWCFLNKMRMIKANIRYKKMIKSGVNVNAGVLCDSIPRKKQEILEEMDKTSTYKGKQEKFYNK